MENVYFITTEPYIGYIKIGKTKRDVSNDRLKELQTGCPLKLIIYNIIKTDNSSKLENLIHILYKEKRYNGEWFKITCNEIDILLGIIRLSNLLEKARGKEMEVMGNMEEVMTDMEDMDIMTNIESEVKEIYESSK